MTDYEFFHRFGLLDDQERLARTQPRVSPKLDFWAVLMKLLWWGIAFGISVGFWWFAIWAGTRLWKP